MGHCVCDKLQHHAAGSFPILRRTFHVIVVIATESGMNRDLFRHALVALTFFVLTWAADYRVVGGAEQRCDCPDPRPQPRLVYGGDGFVHIDEDDQPD